VRTHVKKRRYQVHVKESICAGMVHDASGSWRSGEDKNGFAGARGNKEARDRRPNKGGRVRWTKKGA
jgi:hypothetical protein